MSTLAPGASAGSSHTPAAPNSSTPAPAMQQPSGSGLHQPLPATQAAATNSTTVHVSSPISQTKKYKLLLHACGALLTFGIAATGLACAIYYGGRGLDFQKWSARNDALGACQDTPEASRSVYCNATIAEGVTPPPVLKRGLDAYGVGGTLAVLATLFEYARTNPLLLTAYVVFTLAATVFTSIYFRPRMQPFRPVISSVRWAYEGLSYGAASGPVIRWTYRTNTWVEADPTDPLKNDTMLVWDTRSPYISEPHVTEDGSVGDYAEEVLEPEPDRGGQLIGISYWSDDDEVSSVASSGYETDLSVGREPSDGEDNAEKPTVPHVRRNKSDPELFNQKWRSLVNDSDDESNDEGRAPVSPSDTPHRLYVPGGPRGESLSLPLSSNGGKRQELERADLAEPPPSPVNNTIHGIDGAHRSREGDSDELPTPKVVNIRKGGGTLARLNPRRLWRRYVDRKPPPAAEIARYPEVPGESFRRSALHDVRSDYSRDPPSHRLSTLDLTSRGASHAVGNSSLSLDLPPSPARTKDDSRQRHGVDTARNTTGPRNVARARGQEIQWETDRWMQPNGLSKTMSEVALGPAVEETANGTPLLVGPRQPSVYHVQPRLLKTTSNEALPVWTEASGMTRRSS